MVKVFPRKTNATPEDAHFDGPPLWKLPENDVHVSCTFTYDKPRAEVLADLWSKQGYNVKVGGPAYDDRGGQFVAGRYLKKGYVITSRGCNNDCWFCYTWKREGKIRELKVKTGWNILDSNLLQCSKKHIASVFAMLICQKERPVFTGGLEAALLTDWHVEMLTKIRTKSLYFAYDTPDDYEPLVRAAKMTEGLCDSRKRMCYVLIGSPKDTMDAAESRLKAVFNLGLTPMAMLYRDDKGETQYEWRKFQRSWARPAVIYAKNRT